MVGGVLRSWRRRFVLPLLAALWAAGAGHAQTAPVTPDYFGLNLNRSAPGQPWPALKFGAWRLWDAYVTWPHLEPAPGQWQFAALDRMVDEAQQHGVKLLLVLAQSPAWASARPQEPSPYKPGFAAEPARIEDWARYVDAVARRYRGRIEAYEIWNEASDKSHYSGSVDKLVELACTAQRIIKAADPAAKVVSPASAGPGRHVEYLERFLSAGGKACIDVVAHHFYVPRHGPEAMVPIIRAVKAVMQRQGVGALPLWNTETGWWIANSDGAPDHPAVARGGWRKIELGAQLDALIQRAFIVARAEGVGRFYWYAWANRYGWGLADDRGQAKAGFEGWNTVVGRLLGQSVSGCAEVGGSLVCRLGSGGVLRWQAGDALTRLEGPSRPAEAAGTIPTLQ